MKSHIGNLFSATQCCKWCVNDGSLIGFKDQSIALSECKQSAWCLKIWLLTHKLQSIKKSNDITLLCSLKKITKSLITFNALDLASVSEKSIWMMAFNVMGYWNRQVFAVLCEFTQDYAGFCKFLQNFAGFCL